MRLALARRKSGEEDAAGADAAVRGIDLVLDARVEIECMAAVK